MSSFAQFNLDSRIMSAIERIGYKEPTPIQLQAIPVVMKGGDVMGAAQTGTGKTASFGLPLIARILPHANTSMPPARPAAPCSTHLISSRSRPQRLRRTFLRVRACPSFTFPRDPRHGRRLQPEHLSRRPRFLALIAAAPPNVIVTARNSRDS